MVGFAVRRIISALPLVVGVLTLVFLLVQLVPGDPFRRAEGPDVSREAADRLGEAFGTDRPLPERYLSWLANFLGGDLGTSYSLRRPVTVLLKEAIGNTMLLAGLAIALQFLLGTGAGIAAARLHGSAIDRAVGGAAGILYALPSYWLGLLLTWTLSVRLGWLPASQMHAIDAHDFGPLQRALDALRHLVLPCLSLALPAAGGIALYVRDEMRAALGRGFVQGVRARGVGEAGVILRHGLSNALLPVVNLLGLALPGLVGGSVVIEVLFAWPGMGRLAYQAVLAQDEPLVLGCVWIASLMVIGGNLLADLLSAALDPRVREAVS